MKTAIHTIKRIDGNHEVKLDIFHMDHVEAVDVYSLPVKQYHSGGWRIEGFINNTPAGTKFYSGLPGSSYYGTESDDVAREFLANARRSGILPAVKI